MKATCEETSDEESEGEDGEINLTLMAKSDTDSDSNSSREKIESKNAIKTLNTEISKLEETVFVQKTENSKAEVRRNNKKGYLDNSCSRHMTGKIDLQENEDEQHEIGLVPSSTKQVSTPSLNEGTLLETDSLNVPSESRQELKISRGTIPETVGYNQEEDINYEETFVPFSRMEAIRILIVFIALISMQFCKTENQIIDIFTKALGG
ncbi:hypothetical protein HAX54_014395 [Datura stramonium]|uniref:Uncharacterized protein n=1 Tax=Datura stramonium TaxID=4076 RepID=A0ABS8TN65_DATST|nr:hypothetical protein [Datura stramonium]